MPVLAWGGPLTLAQWIPKDRIPLQSTDFIALFAVLIASYLAVVYYLIPELLAEGRPRSFGRRVADFLLTGFSGGLYMVVLYWLRIDRPLRATVRAQKEHSS